MSGSENNRVDSTLFFRHLIICVTALVYIGLYGPSAWAHTCQAMFQPGSLGAAEIFNPENRSVIEKMVRDVERIHLFAVKGHEPAYAMIAPEIKSFVADLYDLLDKNLPQSEVTRAVAIYLNLVDLPFHFSKKINFEERFSIVNLWVKERLKTKSLRQSKMDHSYSVIRDGKTSIMKFPVKFKFGLFSERQIIESYMSGENVISVSDHSNNIYDTKDEKVDRTAHGLSFHDDNHFRIFIRSFVQDPHGVSLIWSRFESLRAHVDFLLREIDSLKNPIRREDLELGLFFLLHEDYSHFGPNSLSHMTFYERGRMVVRVQQSLLKGEDFERIVKRFTDRVQSGRMGPYYQNKFGIHASQLCLEIMTWLRDKSKQALSDLKFAGT